MKNLDLGELRGQLDEIDGQLVRLFEQRMKICADVAEYKIETGKAVYDGERERQKLEAVGAMAHGDFNSQAVQELFSQLMTVSRKRQYQLLARHGKGIDTGFQVIEAIQTSGARVAYQGVEGSYGHGAALQFFGREASLYHVTAMEDVMAEVEEGRADYGVLPIENSSAGAVSDNYDLLVKHNNYIVAETQLAVRHALLGLPEARLEDVELVYSHPQALMQCSQYLNSHRGCGVKGHPGRRLPPGGSGQRDRGQALRPQGAGPGDQPQQEQYHPVYRAFPGGRVPKGRVQGQHLL